MAKERDSNDGTFTATVTPEDVLTVFDEVPGPVILAGDVVEHLDVSNSTARRHLDSLVHDGTLDQRKASGRNIYWRIDPGSE